MISILLLIFVKFLEEIKKRFLLFLSVLYKVGKNGKNDLKDGRKSKEENRMEASKTKQIITLKNLPSNLVEEAIVVLKTNKKIKNLEYTKKNTKEKDEKKEPEDFYLIKEAEMIVNEYIKEIEKKDYNLFSKQSKLEKKCKKLRYMNIGLLLFSVISLLIHFI